MSFLALLLLFSGMPAPAQEVAEDPEFLFVHKLRDGGYADLAIEYLEKRLAKNPKYAGKPELALEIALTRFTQARKDPDSSRRIALFAKARTELEAFIKNHPTHSGVPAARAQVASVAGLQAKAQLTRALSAPDNDSTREDELVKARKLLGEARKELEASVKTLPDAEKTKAELELGLLALSEVRTYTNEDDKGRDAALKAALAQLNKLVDQIPEAANPIRQQALAWLGRAHSMNGETKESTRKLNDARSGKNTEAHRLADYFDLLNEYDEQIRRTGNPHPKDLAALIAKCNAWLRKYRDYTSDEGLGTQYILAKQYVLLGKATPAEQKSAWDNARKILRGVEGTDNEFAARAQELKIDILFAQKAFTRKLNTLISFEDNYMRALYEHHQLIKDPKKEFEKAEARKAKQEEIVGILRKALAAGKREIKLNQRVPATDLNNAYELLTGYEETLGNLKEAAEVGEEFARKNPRAKQAPLTAMLAADALERLIRKDAGEESEWNMAAERERLYNLGKFMVDRWPGGKPGIYGRYLLVSYLIKRPLTGKTDAEKKAERAAREKEALKLGGDLARFEVARGYLKERHFLEAIKLLLPIQRDYNAFGLVQYQIALAALQIDADNVQKIKAGEAPTLLAPNDKRSFKEIAIAALEKVPEPAAGSTPEANLTYVRAKVDLCKQLYGLGKFDEIEQLGKKLLAALPGLKLPGADDAKLYAQQAETLVLYGIYGKADADYRAGHFPKVADALDPLVKEIQSGKYTELKENQKLLTSLLGMAFRSNLQSERLKRGMEVLEIWKSTDKENKDLISNILKQTVAVLKKQVEDLRKKKDKEKLAKTVNGFSAFLDQVTKDQKTLTPDFRMLLAQSYMGIGKYDKAEAQVEQYLKKEKEPGPKATPQEVARYRLARTLQVRAVRLKGKADNDKKALAKSGQLMDDIMGTDAKPGWGRRDLNALVEQIHVFFDLGFYGAAVNRANALLKIIQPKLQQGGSWTERYFEVYHLFIYSYLKYAQSKKTAAERTAAVAKAAQYYAKLEANHPILGGEESAQRFKDLLASEPELKAAVELARKTATTGAKKPN
jgi:hypothetical protein